MRLTSSEITSLWTQYIQDTMAVCINKYVLATVKDPEIYSLYEFTLGISKKHLKALSNIFKSEKLEPPKGFTEKDVNVDAPPLFTDVFWLGYMHEMTMHGLAGYSISFSVSARKDIRDHYFQCNIDAMEIYNKSIEILLSKGIYQRSPYFSKSQKSQSVTELGYVMDLFGDKRPLNSMEAGNIYFNAEQLEQAKHYFDLAIKKGLDSSDAYFMLGLTLFHMEEIRFAMPYLQRAVELNEHDVEAKFQYGLCLAQLEMVDEAIAEFLKVVNQEPEHADAFYNLGVAYAMKDDKDKAIEMLDEALNVQPDHVMAVNAKQVLSTLEH